MANSTLVVSLLICALVGFAVADVAQLEVFSGSNNYWIAVAIRGSSVGVQSVAIADTKLSFTAMTAPKGWEYWTYNTINSPFSYPVSFRVTFNNGQQITLNKALQATTGATQTIAITAPSGSSPTAAPAPANPTTTTTTTTTKAPSKSSTTTTTTTTTTKAPTVTTTTTTTKSASTGTGCTAPMGMMVPLYVYPGAAWDLVIAGAAKTPTIAIINPNSGPGNGPDASYNSYMTKMANAKVEMVGYVHTSWGARAWKDVKADIDKWASEFPLVNGIFLDEGSTLAKDIPYYTQVYNYIMSLPGYKHVIVNPGIVPDQGYYAISTQIVAYEDYASNLSAAKTPSWASCSNKSHFVAMAHTASSGNMQSIINQIANLKYFGYVYVTDGAGGCCTYNALSTYYAATANYMVGK